MMYSQVLLLLVITAGVRVDGWMREVGGMPLIQFDADCDSYQVTTGAGPRVSGMHFQLFTLVSQCKSLCTGRTDCGGFAWHMGNECYLYNINDKIIEENLSQNWHGPLPQTWYSKTCDYNVGDSDLSCASYTDKEYHNEYPQRKWMIADTFWIPGLTATECQAWCTLYTGCRSVTYRSDDPGVSGWCLMYSTTIQHLLDTGLTFDVIQNHGSFLTYTTYDRYCGDGTPYLPDQK